MNNLKGTSKHLASVTTEGGQTEGFTFQWLEQGAV